MSQLNINFKAVAFVTSLFMKSDGSTFYTEAESYDKLYALRNH